MCKNDFFLFHHFFSRHIDGKYRSAFAPLVFEFQFATIKLRFQVATSTFEWRKLLNGYESITFPVWPRKFSILNFDWSAKIIGNRQCFRGFDRQIMYLVSVFQLADRSINRMCYWTNLPCSDLTSTFSTHCWEILRNRITLPQPILFQNYAEIGLLNNQLIDPSVSWFSTVSCTLVYSSDFF